MADVDKIEWAARTELGQTPVPFTHGIPEILQAIAREVLEQRERIERLEEVGGNG